MMKNRIRIAAFGVALLGSTVMLSCTSKSTSEPTTDTSFDSIGSDYFPIVANQTVSAHITGEQIRYDPNNSIIDIQNVDRDYAAVVMTPLQRLGLPFYSIGAYNDKGDLAKGGKPIGLIASTNNKIVANDNQTANIALVLPPHLSIGLAWNPDPSGSPNYKASFVKYLPNFTANNGNTFKEVIQVDATLFDSTSSYDQYSYETYYYISSGAASVYFAKGVGPVEIRIGNMDRTEYYRKSNSSLIDYSHQHISGVVSRNK